MTAPLIRLARATKAWHVGLFSFFVLLVAGALNNQGVTLVIGVEWGTRAAEALRVIGLINLNGQSYEGHYGTGFLNHPGPAHFAVEALGQLALYDTGLVASRHAAHSIALFVMSAFVLSAIVACAHATRRYRILGLFLATSTAWQLIWFRYAYAENMNDPVLRLEGYAPSHANTHTTFWLAAAAALVLSKRKPWTAPVALLAAAFMIHNHWLGVPYGLLLIVAAFVCLVHAGRSRIDGWRAAAVTSAGIAILFGYPLVVRLLTTGPEMLHTYRDLTGALGRDTSITMWATMTIRIHPTNPLISDVVLATTVALISLVVLSLAVGPVRRSLQDRGLITPIVIAAVSLAIAFYEATTQMMHTAIYLGSALDVPVLLTIAVLVHVAWSYLPSGRIVTVFSVAAFVTVSGLFVASDATAFAAYENQRDISPLVASEVLPALGAGTVAIDVPVAPAPDEDARDAAASIGLYLHDLGRDVCFILPTEDAIAIASYRQYYSPGMLCAPGTVPTIVITAERVEASPDDLLRVPASFIMANATEPDRDIIVRRH